MNGYIHLNAALSQASTVSTGGKLDVVSIVLLPLVVPDVIEACKLPFESLVIMVLESLDVFWTPRLMIIALFMMMIQEQIKEKSLNYVCALIENQSKHSDQTENNMNH